MRRALLGLTVAVGLACLAGCTTGDPAFPTTGTLSFTVLDSTLAGQAAEEPTNQFVKWDLATATAEVAGVGTVDFLSGGTAPCTIAQRIGALASTCRITGLVLEPGTDGTAGVHVVITRLEVIRGNRPEMTATGNVDGDLHPDREDNCPYAPNDDQADANDDGIGDACTIEGGSAPDTDGDTVSDFSDNCVYIANVDQKNTPREDGLGDAVGDECEQNVVLTPPGGLVIDRAGLAFTIGDGRVSVLQLDFKSKDWCDPDPIGTCAITADDVTVSVR